MSEQVDRNITIVIDQNRVIGSVRVLQLEDEPGLKHLGVRYTDEADVLEEDECCWHEADIPRGQYIIGMRAGTDSRKSKITRLDLLLAGDAIADIEEE